MRISIAFLFLVVTLTTSGQTFTSLLSFNGTNGGEPVFMPLTQGVDGNLFGTTQGGGSKNGGTVFKVTPSGVLTTLYSFCDQPNCTDGGAPSAGLLQLSGGIFRGTTAFEGNGHGTLFSISASGAFKLLYTFCSQLNCFDGSEPVGGQLIQSVDGNIYGTTSSGGWGNNGVAFEVPQAGAPFPERVTYRFCSQPNCPDGSDPAGIIEASDGNFYGASRYGALDVGTVFRLTHAGTLTTLYTFCSQANCADGYIPSALIEGNDGNFYGTTYYGGAYGAGTFFKITPAGVLTVLHSFCGADCSDGSTPDAPAMQATDGNFYGTTSIGGDLACNGYGGCGTVFKITPDGTLETLHTFELSDGLRPLSPLFQRTDGKLYGTTEEGGDFNCNGGMGCGTIFSLDLGLEPFVAFIRGVARVGHSVEILGQGFTGASDVVFNGVPASFKVNSDTYLVATVPPGAITGYVTVTTPTGTLTSNKKFVVLPSKPTREMR